MNASSRGGLEVEQWSYNRTLFILVDRIPLEPVDKLILNKKELMFCECHGL